ncbi:sigma 54-interacting transcriptional regulator [uncultured Propionivibrio sp.]|uniref:sigma 54-interacting transcriptional regulator n=1 Tax=uncultured Propionivibrio sp. TaxID=426737 RepID=UPI0029C0342F|nr:sigma 54-interacting transcriptional regulator [uncultured Propionivibrio sp.]
MKADYQILIVDDDESIRRMLAAVLAREGFQTATARDGEEGLALFRSGSPDIVLMDIRMPGLSGIEAMREMLALRPGATVILMTAYADLDTAVQAIKNGVFDFVIKPFDLAEIGLLVNRAYQMREMRREIRSLQHELSETYRFDRIITNDPAMLALCDSVSRIASSNASVVIHGESGVGKELLAASLHYNSARAQHPFVKVNCGAIPEGLLESEFFGHEKGAFTGAVTRRTGRFEHADGGTLFLDEIGELPLALQVKLLRVIQDREFERVGGEKTLKVDVRLVAATNRDLEAMVAAGTFRQDLFYRLNVVSLSVPPLRDRPTDIALLAAHFLRKFTAEHGREIDDFDDHALAVMQRYSWPGNVRELSNAVERAVVMGSGNMILAEDLPLSVVQATRQAPLAGDEASAKTLKEQVRAFEARIIQQALERNLGNRSRTANELGISRRALLYKLHELDLDGDDCAEAVASCE